MRLGIAQLGSLAGDFAATADRMAAYARRAADRDDAAYGYSGRARVGGVDRRLAHNIIPFSK